MSKDDNPEYTKKLLKRALTDYRAQREAELQRKIENTPNRDVQSFLEGQLRNLNIKGIKYDVVKMYLGIGMYNFTDKQLAKILKTSEGNIVRRRNTTIRALGKSINDYLESQ